MDNDQGGVARQTVRQYLGPSIGWADAIGSTLVITASGTSVLPLGTTRANVNVNVLGAVTLILPPATLPTIAAIGAPGQFTQSPITITDTGGNAVISPITIQAAAGETIIGFGSILLNTKFGAFTLLPNSPQHGWNLISL
jgi:hypothetical protein